MGDELRGGYLDGLGALVGYVEIDVELLAGDDGLRAEAAAGVALNATAAATSAAAGDGGQEAEAEGLAEGVVELLLLDEQLVGHVVLCVGWESAGGDVGEELVGLVEALGKEWCDGFWLSGVEGFGGALYGCIELSEARLPGGAQRGGSVVGDGRERGVDAVEVRVLMRGWGGGYACGVEVIGRRDGLRRGDSDAAVLRLLQGEAFAGESDVRACDEGVVGALWDVDCDGGNTVDPGVVGVVLEADGKLPVAGGVVVDAFFRDAGEGNAGIDLEWRPGHETGGDLLGVHLGVGSGVKDLLRHDSCGLVVAVAVRDAACEDGGNDERAGKAHLSDDVAEDAVVAPVFEGFVEGLGEAVVGYTSEGLMDAEVIAGGEELLGAEETELVPIVGGHDVLAAFTAVEREEGGVDTLFTRLVG